ncbi:hypothetical protein DFH09DRAFT_1248185 [Mycena vulgaris]|nr:hypothetical protein DFH09DRAFT_1248185 [Mycena vulgaris]
MEKVSGSEKRKRYESSDDPMAQWRLSSKHCGLCKDEVGTEERERLFRCVECGEFLQCQDCCVDRHQLTPLHFLKEWTGAFWEPTTLLSLDLVYQIGHEGLPCPRPAPAVLSMVVIDTTGIHSVKFRYCACDRGRSLDNLTQLMRNGWYPATLTDPATCATFNVLDMFRLLTVTGNVNARDFMTTLERRTDALGASGMKSAQVPDRYKAFSRIARQYAFLQRLRRAGRGHDPAGLEATKAGEVLVRCWACPQEGRNLPEDWRDVDPRYRFLYMLLLALDANFKLKNRLRANERYDPPLGPGWGAFVEPEGYKEHLKKLRRGNRCECPAISTCIAFAALLQKDTRLTTGLRTSGVGGCVCARHEFGDLQKGERYANMDYIVMAALAGCALMMLTISYDIACQWEKHLPERMEKLPPPMRLDLTKTKNPRRFHTKEMGYGNRADTLEDKIDSHNFHKNLIQAHALQRKLVVAIAERARQVDAFKEVNRTQGIDAFVADHQQPNPYVMARTDGPTEAQIRVALKKDEEEEARKGGSPLHGVSATAFLVAGLQLEDLQRRITAELAGFTLDIYTPAAARAVELEEASRDADAPPIAAEKVRLFLPSELPDAQREQGCQRGIPLMEARLARLSAWTPSARCGATCIQNHLITFRNKNVTGQIKATKSRSLIGSVGDKANAAAKKYRQGRAALIKLRGADHAPHFRELKEEHLTLDGEETQSDTASRKKLSLLSAGKGARTPRHISGSSKKVLSWIWTAQGALDDDEEELHASIRVEWCRAKARKTRWEEEVLLLREEARRVVRYLEWQGLWWDARVDARGDESKELRGGLAAYTKRQAAIYRNIAVHFRNELSGSAEGAVRAIAEEDGDELAEFFMQHAPVEGSTGEVIADAQT